MLLLYRIRTYNSMNYNRVIQVLMKVKRGNELGIFSPICCLSQNACCENTCTLVNITISANTSVYKGWRQSNLIAYCAMRLLQYTQYLLQETWFSIELRPFIYAIFLNRILWTIQFLLSMELEVSYEGFSWKIPSDVLQLWLYCNLLLDVSLPGRPSSENKLEHK